MTKKLNAKRRRHTLRNSVKIFSSAAIVFGSVLPSFAQDIIVDPSAPGTSFLQSSNGTPQINIATPESGVSLNQFETFNVGANGLILNNANAGAVTVIGQNVTANPNLMVSGPASTIVAEVTGSTGSRMTGTTEVAGQQAAVIIANSNGIDCNGCAFLNTTSTTLTTGQPVLSAGSIDLAVTQGTITIGPDGFAPGAQGALVGRQVVLNGPIASSVTGPDGQLLVSGGAQRVQGFDGANVADANIVAAPTTIARTSPFAVDASENATLNAGRVVVNNTEAGQGVNIYGAVTADAFTGTSAGDLFYRDITLAADGFITGAEVRQYGDVQTGGDFAVSGSKFVLYDGRIIESAGDITITGSDYVVIAGEVSGRNVSVEVANGSLINTGFLMADGALSIVAGEDFDQQRQIAREYDTTIDPILQNYLQSYYADLMAGGAAADVAAKMIERAGAHDLIAEYIERGATASGTNVAINASADVNNEGGAIVATDDIVILAGANIVNDYLSLTRQEDLDCRGSRCVVTTNFHSAEILAGGDLTLRAALNIENISSDIAAAGNLSLIAGHDVVNTFAAPELSDAASADVTRGITLQAAAEGTSGGARYVLDREELDAFEREYDRIVSPARVVSLYGDVSIDAGRDFVSMASEVTSGGDLNITAAGDVLVSGHTALNCRSRYSCGSTSSTADVGYDTTFARLTGRDVSVQAAGNVNVIGARLMAAEDLELVSQAGEVFVAGEELSDRTERPDLDFAAYSGVTTGGSIDAADAAYLAFLVENDLLTAVEALRLAESGADIKAAAGSVGAQSYVSVIDSSGVEETRAALLAELDETVSTAYLAIEEQDALILDAHALYRADLATLLDELVLTEAQVAEYQQANADLEAQSLVTLNTALQTIDDVYQAALTANEAAYQSRIAGKSGWLRSIFTSQYARTRDQDNAEANADRLVAIEMANGDQELALLQARAAFADHDVLVHLEEFEVDRDTALATANDSKGTLVIQIQTETADAMRAAEALIEQEALEDELRRNLIAEGSIVEGNQSFAMALTNDLSGTDAAFTDATAWQYQSQQASDDKFPWSVASAQDDLRLIAQTGLTLNNAGIVANGTVNLSSLADQNFASARVLGGDVQMVSAGNLVSEGSHFIADATMTVVAAGDIVFAPRIRVYKISNGAEHVIGSMATWDLTKYKDQQLTSLEHSVITSGSDLTIDTMGSLTLAGARVTAGANLTMTANGDVRFLAPHAIREYHRGSSSNGKDSTSAYQQITDLHAVGDITLRAGNNAVFEGTRFVSGENIDLAAVGDLTFSAAQYFYEYRYRYKKRRWYGTKRKYRTTDRVTHTGAVLQAANDIMLESTTGNLTLAGADLDATNGSLNISATEGNILVGAFTDIYKKTSKSSFSTLGGLISNTNRSSSTNRTSTGTDALAGVNLTIASGRDTILRGAKLEAGAELNLNVGGDLIIEAAISDHRSEMYNERLGAVLATTETETSFRETAVLTTLTSDGDINISVGGETRITIYNESGEEATPISELYPEELTALSGLVLLDRELLDEYFYDETKALSPAFTVVLTTVLTQGFGTYLQGAKIAGLVTKAGKLTHAGKAVAAMAASTTVGIANGTVSGELDMGEILRNAAISAGTQYLTSSINLKATGQGAAADAATASGEATLATADDLGTRFLTGGTWSEGMSASVFGTGNLSAANILEGAFDAGISAGVQTAANGTDFNDGFRASFVSSVVALGLADTQNEIGDLFADGAYGGEGSLGHIMLHGIAGCAAAEAQGADCSAGAAGGIAGAVYAGTLEGTNLSDQEQRQQAELIGVTIGYLFSGGEANNVSAAGSIAVSGLANNRQLHRKEIERIEENAEGFARLKGLCDAQGTCSSEAIAEATNILVQQAAIQVDEQHALSASEDQEARAYLLSITPEGYIPGTEGDWTYIDENQEWFAANTDHFENHLINVATVAENPEIYRALALTQRTVGADIERFILTLTTTNAESQSGDLSPQARVETARAMLDAFNGHLASIDNPSLQELAVLSIGQLVQAAVRSTLLGMYTEPGAWDQLSAEEQSFAATAVIESYIITLGSLPGGQGAPTTRVRLPNGETATLTRTPNGSYRVANHGRGTSKEWIIGHNTTTGYNRDNGIVGGHNQAAFDTELRAQGGKVTGTHTDPSMPGVRTVTYQVAARDQTGTIIPGQYRSQTFNKTTYDPSVLSNQRVAKMSAQAGQRATFSNGARETQVSIDGYQFRVYRNVNTGEVTNSHLVTP